MIVMYVRSYNHLEMKMSKNQHPVSYVLVLGDDDDDETLFFFNMLFFIRGFGIGIHAI